MTKKPIGKKEKRSEPADDTELIAAFLGAAAAKKENVIISIDTGLDGAIAFVCGSAYLVFDMPVTTVKGSKTKRVYDEERICAYLLPAFQPGILPLVFVAIEQAAPNAGRGNRTKCKACKRTLGDTPTTAFKVAWGCAMFKLLLVAYGVRHGPLNIAAWKRHAGLIGADKEASRLLGQKMFPGASLTRKKDHNRAEALLMSRYAASKYDIDMRPAAGPLTTPVTRCLDEEE